MMRPRSDDGSILPLTACFGALALVLVLLVTAATSLYLERKRLFSLADAAAVSAAESFALAEVQLTAEGPRPVLWDAEVRSAALDILGRMPVDGFEALRLTEATTPDGRSASITLTSRWRPPVVTLFLPEGIPIEVTSVARSVFG